MNFRTLEKSSPGKVLKICYFLKKGTNPVKVQREILFSRNTPFRPSAGSINLRKQEGEQYSPIRIQFDIYWLNFLYSNSVIWKFWFCSLGFDGSSVGAYPEPRTSFLIYAVLYWLVRLLLFDCDFAASLRFNFFPGLLPQIVGVAPEKAIKLTVSTRFIIRWKNWYVLRHRFPLWLSLEDFVAIIFLAWMLLEQYSCLLLNKSLFLRRQMILYVTCFVIKMALSVYRLRLWLVVA